MISRRGLLKTAAGLLVAAAAGQIEVVEAPIEPVRRFWPGWGAPLTDDEMKSVFLEHMSEVFPPYDVELSLQQELLRQNRLLDACIINDDVYLMVPMPWRGSLLSHEFLR